MRMHYDDDLAKLGRYDVSLTQRLGLISLLLLDLSFINVILIM